jgi:hypothetical protein
MHGLIDRCCKDDLAMDLDQSILFFCVVFV